MNPSQEATSRALRHVETTQPWLPMGGCSTWQAHYAHLEAGDHLCENERTTDPTTPPAVGDTDGAA